MPTKIVSKDIKFYSELVNGSNFDQNLGSYTDNFADSPTGKCRVETVVEIFSGFEIQNYQILIADENAIGQNDTFKIYQTRW